MNNYFDELNKLVKDQSTLEYAINAFESACGQLLCSQDMLLFESGIFELEGQSRYFFVLARESNTSNGRVQLVLELSIGLDGLKNLERASYVSDMTDNREEDGLVFFDFVRAGETYSNLKTDLFDVRIYMGNTND